MSQGVSLRRWFSIPLFLRKTEDHSRENPSFPEITALSESAVSGLSSKEVRDRLNLYGPNEVPTPTPNLSMLLFRKLLGPISAMLAVTFVFEIVLHNKD
ncbi:MAG: cation-transporting P-type ATPase [Leptospirales bacterium]